jgi:cathepsin B
MKAVLLASVATAVLSSVVTEEMINDINARGEWKASNQWIKTKTAEDLQKLTGTIVRTSHHPRKNWGALLDNLTIPASFDSRTQWPSCIHPIRDQGQCGSCWAFGATEAFSDRVCIAKGVNVVLSPQYLVSCDNSNYGCNGGYLDLAWEYLENPGVPADSCDVYVSGGSGQDGSCPSTCADGTTPKLFKAKNVYSFDSPASIQAEILANGPIETAFTVYQDFFSYTSGIYTHVSGGVAGGHAVKIIGWGNQNGTNYWIVANSWGTSWGINGFFNIAFGQCGIDTDGIAGEPQ